MYKVIYTRKERFCWGS